VGPATARAVAGGWRVAVPVPDAGPYRVDVRCTAAPDPAGQPSTATGSTGSTAGAAGLPALPATGGADGGRLGLALLLGLAAAGVRAIGGGGTTGRREAISRRG
jgi:hypothetical protein